MKLLIALLLLSPAMARPFQIVPSRASAGSKGSLLITLQSADAKELVALQWTITVGSGVSISEIVASDASTKAGKTIHCAKSQKLIEEAYSCLLAGGTASIPDGAVFVVHYNVQPNLPPQVVPVTVSRAIGVLQVGGRTQKLDLEPAEGTITVQ